MALNLHHKRAVRLLTAVVALDQGLGALFGHVNGVGALKGMYFGVVTVTTVGYGDITPHGWAAYLAAVAIMVLIIPLWTGVFSLVTTGLTADHVDVRHEELKGAVTGDSGAGPEAGGRP